MNLYSAHLRVISALCSISEKGKYSKFGIIFKFDKTLKPMEARMRVVKDQSDHILSPQDFLYPTF